jgi:hypothetical protein
VLFERVWLWSLRRGSGKGVSRGNQGEPKRQRGKSQNRKFQSRPDLQKSENLSTSKQEHIKMDDSSDDSAYSDFVDLD